MRNSVYYKRTSNRAYKIALEDMIEKKWRNMSFGQIVCNRI